MKGLLNAFQDSLSLLDMRYRIIRNSKGKVMLWLFIISLAFSILLASYTGFLIKLMASSTGPNAETARIYASTYLNYYLNGELGPLVATTLGLAILSVMAAPFTGTSVTSLISHSQLVSIRANNRHRFTDSVITQFFSSISLLQLLTLTSVASLLTIDGGHKEGILYAWASWPVLVILSTLFVWVAEYLYRKFGEKNRLLMLAVAVLGIVLVVVFNPEQALTVFGIGTGYAQIIQGFYTFSPSTRVMAFLILVALWGIFAFLAHQMSRVALSLPDTFAKASQTQRTIKARRPSAFPSMQISRVILMLLWRNTEIRKPIIMSGGFAVLMLYALSGNESMTSTIVFIIPLMVSLSWGSNIFGIVGTGLPWILSQPFSTRGLLWVFAGVQMVVVSVTSIAALAPALLFGRMSLDAGVSFALGLVACSAVMTRSSLTKAVHNPHPYRSGQRGESILPPATLLSYTLRFSLWSGLLGLIVFSVIEDRLLQLAIAGAAVVWSCLRMAILDAKFQKNADIRNKIVFTVSHN